MYVPAATPLIPMPTVNVPATPPPIVNVVPLIVQELAVAVFAVTDTTFCPLNPAPPIICPVAIVPTT